MLVSNILDKFSLYCTNLINKEIVKIPQLLVVWKKFSKVEKLRLHYCDTDKLKILILSSFLNFFLMLSLSLCSKLSLKQVVNIIIYFCELYWTSWNSLWTDQPTDMITYRAAIAAKNRFESEKTAQSLLIHMLSRNSSH